MIRVRIVHGKLLPKAVNALGEHGFVHIGAFPDGIEQRVLANGLPARAREQKQHLEFFGTKRNGRSTMAQRFCAQVEYECSKDYLRHTQDQTRGSMRRDAIC